MICKSCGSVTDEYREECPVCGGKKLILSPDDKVCWQEDAEYRKVYDGKLYDEDNFYSPHPDMSKKQSKRHPIKSFFVFLGIVALVSSLLAGAYVFRADILMATFPREYAAYSLYKTAKQFGEDASSVSREILGFDLKNNNDYTLNTQIEYPKNLLKQLQICYAPSESTLRLDASKVKLCGENVDLSLLWDNRVIGLYIPDVTDNTYFAVASKRFGSQIMNSSLTPIANWVKSQDMDLNDINLAFDNIIKDNKSDGEYDELKERLIKASFDFIRRGEVKKKYTSKTEIDGEYKRIHCLSAEFNGNIVKDYLNRILNIIETDEELREEYGDTLSELAVKLRKNIQKNKFDYSVTVDVQLRKDRAIGFDLINDRKKDNLSLDIKTSECMPDSFSVEYRGKKNVFSFSAKGNIMPKNGRINYKTILETGNKSYINHIKGDLITNEISLFKKTNGKKKTLKGKWSKDSGFEFDVSGEGELIKISLKEGAVVKTLPGEEYMIAKKALGTVLWDFGRLSLKNKTARNVVAEVMRKWFANENKKEEKQNEKFPGIKFNIS